MPRATEGSILVVVIYVNNMPRNLFLLLMNIMKPPLKPAPCGFFFFFLGSYPYSTIDGRSFYSPFSTGRRLAVDKLSSLDGSGIYFYNGAGDDLLMEELRTYGPTSWRNLRQTFSFNS